MVSAVEHAKSLHVTYQFLHDFLALEEPDEEEQE